MKTERTVYVIYVTGKGFCTGKNGKTVKYYEDFTRARVFTSEHFAKISINYHKAAKQDLHPTIIPVQLSLDPEKLFTSILSDK